MGVQDCTRFQSSDEGPEPQENSQQSDCPSSSPDLEGPGLTPLSRQGRADPSSSAVTYRPSPHLPLPLNLGFSKPLIRDLLSPYPRPDLKSCSCCPAPLISLRSSWLLACGGSPGPLVVQVCSAQWESGLPLLALLHLGHNGGRGFSWDLPESPRPFPYAEASWGSSNKFPQTWWPDPTGIYSLTILEAESKICHRADITVHAPEALGDIRALRGLAAGIPWLAARLQISLPLFTSPSPPRGVTSLPLLQGYR